MDQVDYALPGAVATYSAKSALFTAGLADRGTFFDNTGSYTISLAAAATLGAGWSCWIRNVSGTQTIDPDSTELINGASTYAVSNGGDIVLVECTGTAFVVSHTQRPSTVAITGGTINSTTIGATTATTGRFTTVESTVATGTAPFIVASTTVVSNLNAALLNGTTWTAPGAIGGGTPAAGSFTTGSFTDAVTLTTASSGLTIGKTTGTTLVVSSTATTCATFAGGATFGGEIVATAANPTRLVVLDASTNTAPSAFQFEHQCSGTPIAAFGVAIDTILHSSTNTRRVAMDIVTTWVVATDASRTARTRFFALDTGFRECIRIEASGSAPMVGLYGTNAAIQYATTGTTTGFTAGAGTAVLSDSTFTGNTGATAYTIGDIVRALKLIGVMTA
jgi:hypothetical protein